MNKNKPDNTTIVIVPSDKLYSDWTDPVKGHIAAHNLKNVKVFIINTYVRYKHSCNLLIIDEIHSTGAESFSKVFDVTEYDYILGLTATIERLDGKHEFIVKYAPIVDVVDIDEARKNDWVSKFKVFNYGINIKIEDDEEYQDLNNKFNTNFAKFNHSFDLMIACGVGDNTEYGVKCYPGTFKPINSTMFSYVVVKRTGKEWREWQARELGWNGEPSHQFSPKMLMINSIVARKAMRERKLFLFKHPKKIEAIVELTKALKVQTILFGEDADIATEIEKILGTDVCRAYHSKLETVERRVDVIKSFKTKPSVTTVKTVKFGKAKLKKEIIDLFEKKKIRVLSTVRALDEGFDVQGIEMAIQHSFNSSKRQGIQRSGRAIRYDFNNPDKVAIIINLYIRDSQEQTWLKNKQDGIVSAINVRSVQELLARL